MLALDISNYTDELDDDVLRQWKEAGVGLVIIQAFPPSYYQYAEQQRQVEACVRNDMPFDHYIYDYLGDPTWLWEALDGIEQQEHKPRQVWLDEEDVDTERGWSATRRVNRIAESLACVRERGHDCGIYTAKWWWGPKTNDSTRFSDVELWDADYDREADTEASWEPYGGWTARRIKQYAGTSTFVVGGLDMNVLSVGEENEVADEERVEETVADEDLPDEAREMGCSDWRCYAINLKGIADDLGRQMEERGRDDTELLTRARDDAAEANRRVEELNARVRELESQPADGGRSAAAVIALRRALEDILSYNV